MSLTKDLIYLRLTTYTMGINIWIKVYYCKIPNQKRLIYKIISINRKSKEKLLRRY